MLTTPRLSIQHGVTAIFDATTKIPIVSTTATATSTVQTIQSLDIGERMTITPFIDTDRGIVTMKLIPEISTRGQSVDVGIQAVPEKNTRKVETLLRVRDGESIVIGGLMRQSTNESRAKIPILGDIPILGHLFKSTSVTKQKRNLMVFIKATIVREGSAISGISKTKYNYIRAEQLKRDEEGIRLMPFTDQVVLPEWDDSLALPPTFDEYMNQQPVTDGTKPGKQD